MKSYEDCLSDRDYDYDVLRITEFSRGPSYNTDIGLASDLTSPTSLKVNFTTSRYNIIFQLYYFEKIEN